MFARDVGGDQGGAGNRAGAGGEGMDEDKKESVKSPVENDVQSRVRQIFTHRIAELSLGGDYRLLTCPLLDLTS